MIKMKYPTRIHQDFEKIRNENKSVLENKWGYRLANDPIKQIFTKNNPRFIFELIQNANDAKAKRITFIIKDQELEVKKEIIEHLWKIIISDQNVDHYEANLMRRICGLIYFPDKLCGEIKIKVLEKTS